MKINLLWQKSEKIAIALSGGVDSIVLFNLLVTKYKDTYRELVIFHINHGLRRESEIEKIFVKELAKKYNLKICTRDLKLKEKERKNHTSEEMLARKMRYEAFFDFAKENKIKNVLTAHHRNDCVENIILRLCSGRSKDYNLSILKRQKLENIVILRPMLDIQKEEIINYAKKNNLKFYQDETNFDTNYQRNYVRHKIIPLLKGLNQSSEENLISFSNYYNELREQVKKNLQAKDIKITKEKDKISFKLTDFNNLSIIEKNLFITKILNENFDIYTVKKDSISKNIDKIYTSQKNISLDLKENLKIIKEYDSISIYKIEKKCYNNKIKILKEDLKDEKIYTFNNFKILISSKERKGEVGFNKKDLPLLITTKKAGDKLKRGKIIKKISRIFIDEKIPKYLRERLPIIRKEQEIIGVLGINSKTSKNRDYDYYIKLI